MDKESNKICLVQTPNAIFSMAYTGVAVANHAWFDCVIANCLAHRQLALALVQPGSRYLARPMHVILDELRVNLNGQLNLDPKAKLESLTVSIVGWHLGRRLTPFFWKMSRGSQNENGFRYFEMTREHVGKFLRKCPNGLYADYLGDTGTLVQQRLDQLESTNGWNHDDVERHIRQAILDRSKETQTVSGDCLAVQIDPTDGDGHFQVTFYPAQRQDGGYPLVSPWVLTPRMICAPSITSSAYGKMSECGAYLTAGFSDGNTKLHIRTRIPKEHAQATSSTMWFRGKERAGVV